MKYDKLQTLKKKDTYKYLQIKKFKFKKISLYLLIIKRDFLDFFSHVMIRLLWSSTMEGTYGTSSLIYVFFFKYNILLFKKINVFYLQIFLVQLFI